MMIFAKGSFRGSPGTTRLLWLEGEIFDDDPVVRHALDVAADEPVLALPEVITNPLKDPLGFVGCCRRVLDDPLFFGDAEARQLLEGEHDAVN